MSTETITESALELAPGITEDDKLLWRKDKNAVEFSLNYAKLWSKFCKDLIVTMEKKASIENDSNRAIMKLCQGFESTLNSSSMIGSPMRNETISMCKLIAEQCKELEVQNNKKVGKLLEVISRQRTEFGKTRKHIKDKWKGDCKKMMDAENAMLKTRSGYYQRCQQGVKLREELTNAQSMLNYMRDQVGAEGISNANSSGSQTPQSGTIPNFEAYGSSATLGGSNQNDPNQVSTSQLSKQKLKVDKLEKQLADNDKKEIEQMYSYKESVENANQRLLEFEKRKLEHLCDIRLTTARNDEVVRDSMAAMVQILIESREAIIAEYTSLGGKFREHKPCQEYKLLIDKQTANKSDSYAEKFQVELFHDSAVAKEKSESQISRGFSRFGLGIGKDTDHESKNRGVLPSHSDSDSDPEYNVDQGAPTGTSNRTGVLNTIVEFGSNFFMKGGNDADGSGPGGSGNAGGYNRKGGSGGGISGSGGSTKKSTSGSTSSMGCGGNQDGETSGRDIYSAEWSKELAGVLEIVLKCIQTIEKQDGGLCTHGIYRVSASKSKVAAITEALQSSTSTTELESEATITLASAVKSKLISLSEPLVPYNLYTEFVELGKEAETATNSGGGDSRQIIVRLNLLIQQIPLVNQKLLGLIFHHLYKVSCCSDENQMGSTNLGTLFAPTLIKTKPRFRNVDIKEYMDNKSQAKIVQLIIENVEYLFGAEDLYYNSNLIVELDDKLDTLKRDSDDALTSKYEFNKLSTNSANNRSQSAIIDSSASLDPSSSSASNVFTRQLSGNLRVPSPSTNYLKPTGDESSIDSASLSPRLREKKISTYSLNDEESATPTNTAAAAGNKTPSVSPVAPHRSISFTNAAQATTSATGDSAGFKLAQLSQPSNDSIFNKKLLSSASSSTDETKPVGDRSINLKKSFISNANASVTTDTKSSPQQRSFNISTSTSPASRINDQKRTTGINASRSPSRTSSGNLQQYSTTTSSSNTSTTSNFHSNYSSRSFR